MTTDMPEQDIDATTSVIRCIVANKKIDKLLQNMLATCTTVEEYTERLNGLLRIFWGDNTPDNKNMDDVKWIDVMVQVLSVENMIPLFKQSMLEYEVEISDDKTKEYDPDGWDRQDYEYSWNVEQITETEYKRRRSLSTCKWTVSPLILTDQD